MQTSHVARLVSLYLLLLTACGPQARSNTSGDAPQPGDKCTDGQTSCNGKDFLICNNGVYERSETCDLACSPTIWCTVCTPGTGTCSGEVSTACKPDGSGYYEETCDAANGSTCDATQGVCVGACSAATLGTSYVGCNYYATQSAQFVSNKFDFGVVLSNTASSVATVTIDGGKFTAPVVVSVAPNQAIVQKLPWVEILKRCNASSSLGCGGANNNGAFAKGGAYRIRSNQPITAYQLSPIEYSQNGRSYSNDASLLLPVNAWSGNHVVASWPTWNGWPSLLTVTAATDNTAVEILSKANTNGGDGAMPFTAGVAQTVVLNKGDVIELLSPSGDLTGSRVTSDKPVEVLAGHYCTQVPIGTPTCDHLEEIMFPVETLATRYIVAANSLPGAATPRSYVVRVVATTANTQVTFDPALATGPVTLAAAGDFYELPIDAVDRLISGNQKILVAQYMVGSEYPGGNSDGDPSMALAVPVAQYRRDYQFVAPVSYATNYVNITAATGAAIMLDGQPVPLTAFSVIGTSGFSVARIALPRVADATHRASSDQPFGNSVYGYGSDTSYWYPGGLDLLTIPVE
jgi:IgGFc binding protein